MPKVNICIYGESKISLKEIEKDTQASKTITIQFDVQKECLVS